MFIIYFLFVSLIKTLTAFIVSLTLDRITVCNNILIINHITSIGSEKNHICRSVDFLLMEHKTANYYKYQTNETESNDSNNYIYILIEEKSVLVWTIQVMFLCVTVALAPVIFPS